MVKIDLSHINKKDFAEDFIMLKRADILKKYNISVTSLRNLKKEMGIKKYTRLDEKIVEDFLSGIDRIETIKKYNIYESTYYRILNKHNIDYHLLKERGTKKHLKMFNSTEFVKVKKGEYGYVKKCSKCGKEHILSHDYLIKNLHKINSLLCKECICTKDNFFDFQCSKRKRNTNKSGFIGVSIYKNYKLDEILGYTLELKHKKIKLMRQVYKDKELHEKTLIQAATDRDLFIIEKGLPHKRNFTNKELLGNLEYLAHEQLKAFKERVKDGLFTT